MLETLVYCLLYGAGITHLAPWMRHREQAWLVASGGLLIGLCGYVISAMLLSSLQIFSPLISLAILGITGFTIALRYRTNLEKHKGPILIGLLAVFLLSWNFSNNTYLSVSYDSYQLILIGQQVALDNGFSSETEARLASWGSFLPMVHSLAIALEKDFLGALHPTTSLVGLWTLAVACFFSAKRYLNNVGSLLLTGSAIAFLASSFFLVFQASYVHNSLLATCYLALALHAMLQWGQHEDRLYLIVAGIGFLAFALLRVESPIFTAVIVACLYPLVNQPNSDYLKLVNVLTIAIGAWYLYLALVIGGGSDILTPSRVAIVMAPLVGWAVLLNLSTHRFGSRLNLQVVVQHAWWLLPVGAVFATIAAWLIMGEHLAQSTTSMQTNLFLQGRWGYLWLGFVMALALLIATPMDRQTKYLLAVAVTFILGVLLLSLGRNPYRLGWGDSGNRIMTQSIAILTLAMVGGIAHKFSLASVDGVQPTRRVRRYAPSIAICGLVVALYNPLTGLVRAPENILSKATIIEQPAWSKGHEAEVSLQHDPSKSYSASAAAGPAIIEFDLEQVVPNGIVRVQDYHASLAMEEFTWSIATPSGDWVTIAEHGTRNAGIEESVTYLDPTHYCFPLTQPTTKLRLQFLKGKDQNRLLVRHISLTATNAVRGSWSNLKPNQPTHCEPS